MGIIIILLIAILVVLFYIASILQHWLYIIAKNQKDGYEAIYNSLENKEN